MGDIDEWGEGYACVEARAIWEISVPSPYTVNLKLLEKNVLKNLKRKKGTLMFTSCVSKLSQLREFTYLNVSKIKLLIFPMVFIL